MGRCYGLAKSVNTLAEGLAKRKVGQRLLKGCAASLALISTRVGDKS